MTAPIDLPPTASLPVAAGPGRRSTFGRLVRSPLYHEMRVPEFKFTTVDGPTVLAHDGEVGTECTQATFSVRYRALPVFRPHR